MNTTRSRRRMWVAPFLVTLLGVISASAQTLVREPGGTPQDVDAAINTSDEHAWQLFLFLNRQATPGSAGIADPPKTIKQYDDDADVVWETWALASGQSDTQDKSEVYKTDGSKPMAWKDLSRGTAVAKVFSTNNTALAVVEERAATPGNLPLFSPIDVVRGDFEVRMNQAAFEHVSTNELYNVEGLESQLQKARAAKNPGIIQFPKAAKEVKANWVKMEKGKEAEDKKRYHWRQVGNDVYKLTGFHIITKDLPAWFWTDFEHVDFEKDALAVGQPSRDSTTRGTNAPAKGAVDGERREPSGTKWAYYRLRGTQTSFVDERGNPIIVGNTKIEDGFVDRSSCMTCHARASVGMRTLGPDGKLPTKAMHLSGGRTDIGNPKPEEFVKNGVIQFLQTDFIWSAPFRASAKK
jgi:hypothetical protein